MKATTLLLTLYCLVRSTLASQGKVQSGGRSENALEDNFSKVFPCPEVQDIFPCVCSYNTDSLALLLDCSAVEDGKQLAAVFSATFPVTTFTELKIENNDGLTVLGEVFSDVTFERVYLSNVWQLYFITEKSFFGSRNTLQILQIYGTKLSTSTVPILTFGLYPNFYRFVFDGNDHFTSFPALESNFLTYINFRNWNIASLPVEAFRGTPNIAVIGAFSLALTEVIPGTFDDLPYLYLVNLGGNNISRLLPGTLSVTKMTYYINFRDNLLDTVEVGAFKVESGSGSITPIYAYFENNLMTTLDRDVWQDLMEVITAMDLRGNPLTCGCDLSWLVLAPDLMAKIHPDSTCNDGTLLHDLDPTVFGNLC